MVVYLASEKCPFTGSVFAVQGGAVALMDGWTAAGTAATEGPWESAELTGRLDAWA
ncbi:hypothetical protein HUT18_30650 [Streptomyces sp. NA04227]|uniref:hypothetical protein n=1 Tax=Streptomyces sp. NA04227 TaxID=2742136 RepID=UPI00159178A4|nr:hypothetical protein [Streptomyces sp. NA04227]QKW10115.1 hypothetical protein HUT18_30650 [Streptomyces sp. NA04227]